MNVLINSTVLSNFAAIDRLPLLQVLYGTVYISQAVYEEIQIGVEKGYIHFSLRLIGIYSRFIRKGGYIL